MKKLTKEQRATRDRLIGELEILQTRVETAIEAYKTKCQEAQAFAQDVSEEIQSYIGERSDKWQESDVGIAFSEWQQSWENLELPEFTADDDSQASERLGELDEEPAL